MDSASANLAASFGMSIGQNGCAGVYPAMLATIVAPTVGIDVLSPTFFVPLIAVVAISSFGVAGVGGGATFASLIVLGTMGLPIEVVAVLRIRGAAHRHGGRTALNVSDSMVAGITASHCRGRPRPLGSGRSGGACHRRGARELTGMKKALEGGG